MADLTQKERLQPSLLDRLTDNDPERKQESRDSRVLSPSRLRDCVRRDLAWLLNTTHLRAMQNLDEHPQVARSVLNYGMPDLAGRTTSGVDTTVLEQAIRKAILDFEPRLVAKTLRVKLFVDEKQMNHNAMSFDIEAELWAQPLPLRLFLRTAVDLETGTIDVLDLGSKGAG
ncbi:MAG TPA: type VI secretion system baseplate subunit TssE [Polyangia bacterium]|jgi:type VI secretion system protein ImpF